MLDPCGARTVQQRVYGLIHGQHLAASIAPVVQSGLFLTRNPNVLGSIFVGVQIVFP